MYTKDLLVSGIELSERNEYMNFLRQYQTCVIWIDLAHTCTCHVVSRKEVKIKKRNCVNLCV